MIDERIVRFVSKHHVLTLATIDDQGAPYCCNAFYCYDKGRNLLIFSSDCTTLHAQQMAMRPRVAVSIAVESRVVGKLQGVQMCGVVSQADPQAKLSYLKRFPFAVMIDLTLWVIEPNFMKFTDNTLGFGKKLIWNVQE